MTKPTQALVQLLSLLGILLAINYAGNSRLGKTALYGQIDLTEEKRFTLSPATKDMLFRLDDVVEVSLLLEGDFPAGFKRLQTAAVELIEDFQAVSPYVQYHFENPNEGSTEQINQRREELAKDNILPTRLTVNSNNERSQQYIYPWAIFYYKGRNLKVNLLENDIPGQNQELVLNNSVALLEYKFANAIQKLQTVLRPVVAFSTGHGELTPIETADLEKSLREHYDTGRIYLDSAVVISQDLDVLLVAKPRAAFSEKEKFKLDQYIMNGGKVLWLMDRINVSLDSLRGKAYMPLDYETNLEDLFFNYGFRIQPNLVLDLQNSRIPLATSMVGNQPQFEYFPYPYHIVATPDGEHPVAKGVGPINLLYASSIDTTVQVKTPLRKTVLLHSTANTLVQYLPLEMNFRFLEYDPEPEQYNKPVQVFALLLEGVFPSIYRNRITESMMQGLRELDIDVKKESEPGAMIVVADGDVAKNHVPPGQNRYDPLGYNPFEKFTFSNKDFLLNAIEYLIDEQGIMEARNKEVKLRLLDQGRLMAEKKQWQWINLMVPLVLLLVFGLVYHFLRKRKYGR